MMTFSEAYWTVQLVFAVGVMIFSVENDCGTAWETVISLGASCPA